MKNANSSRTSATLSMAGVLFAVVIAAGLGLSSASHAAAGTGLHVVTSKPSAAVRSSPAATKQRMSPYARAAAAKAHAAQGSTGRASLMQSTGRPHRPQSAGAR
jgi:hypothetical protein